MKKRWEFQPHLYTSKTISKYGFFLQYSNDFSITLRLRISFWRFDLDLPIEYIKKRKLSLEERDELIRQKNLDIVKETLRRRNRRKRGFDK